MTSALPTLRLKPKTNARRIAHGFPWVYANEIVTDRRTRAIAPGSIAVLENENREPIAMVAVNLNSKIAGRVLDLSIGEVPEAEWFHQKIRQAAAFRKKIYSADFYRLVHAEADGLPGLVIDRFGDVAVIQPNSAWAEANLDRITDAVMAETGVARVFKNASGRARVAEGLDDTSVAMIGSFDAPLPVEMNGATYFADIIGGQKTGLFFDQRDNHHFVAQCARDTRVLDVFSHVGGFGLAALAGGATSTICVDGSEAALGLASQGAAEMGCETRFTSLKSDAFDALSNFSQDGAQFGTVICDPPAFAPHKGALEAGLRAYEKVARLAAPLVETGGTLTLCSCSHAASLEKFRTACIRGIGRAGRKAQILRTGFASPDHPQHPQLAESGYLKAITFGIRG